MLQAFTRNIETSKLLAPQQTYVVAVSGGRDSVVLLDMLSRLQDAWGWKLIVAHLDHGQRPEAADDARFVGTLADHYGHKFMLGMLPRETMSESAMRQARYKWLEEIRRESDADRIITGHHRNDRLETAMWHALRGADRVGLTSLGAQRGVIVRPLIGFGRGDIITYAASRDLAWREDATNNDRAFTRNLIRHELLHYAPTRDPHYHNNLADWLDHLDGINDRITTKLDHLAAELAQPVDGGFELSREKFLRLNPIVQLNLLAHLARRINDGIGLTERNLNAALRWFASAKSGSFSEALPGLLLLREYDRVKFVSRSARPMGVQESGTVALRHQQPVRIGRFELELQPAESASELSQNELIANTYFARTWQPGDRIHPLGMQGSKKLQDLFTDKKVPKTERLLWPVIVTAHNDIALVPDLARDRRFAPNEQRQPAHRLQVKVV